MKQIIGCAGLIAMVPLLIGMVATMFLTDVPLSERLMLGTMPAVLTFFAALILVVRDRNQNQWHHQAVRNRLLNRSPLHDDEFVSHFPDVDAEILILTRKGIGRFFDVDPDLIHPSDELEADFHFSSLEPSFHTAITFFVLAQKEAIAAPFTFYCDKLSDVGTLAAEILRIFKSLDDSQL